MELDRGLRRGRATARRINTLAPALFVLAFAACRESAEEHIRKAHVLFSNKELDKAQAEYEKAVAIEADSEIALEGLGNIAFERGDVKGALSWYEKATAADAKAINARHRLAVAKSELGDLPGAVAALEEALAIDPDNTFALNALGGLHQKMGDLKRAEERQLAALRVDPEFRAARFALASILVDTSRFDDAERELTKLHTRGAEALAEYGFARLEAKRGRAPEAAKRLTRVLELGVAHPSKVLSDDVFNDAWSDPAMQAIRQKLEQAAKQ
jgi:tetratricopeptide (TPR) repeat protein